MNPYHFVVFHKNPGYRALVRQKDQTIQGIIVVTRDSPFTELSDLNGTKIAFPAPAAFAASIIPRATMQKEGINFTPVYVHSHDSVYLNVKRGFFKAGGGIYRSLQAMRKGLTGQSTSYVGPAQGEFFRFFKGESAGLKK